MILSRYDDSIQPHVIYTGTFQPDGLRGFVQENKLPRLVSISQLRGIDIFSGRQL